MNMDKILVEQLHSSQQVNEQLEEQVRELQAENESLKQQLINSSGAAVPDYLAARDRKVE